MKKIGISDFCNYHYLSSLNMTPCGSKLLFVDTTVKEDMSDYQQRVMKYDVKTGECSVLVDYTKRTPIFMIGHGDFLVGVEDKDEKFVSTSFKRICPKSGMVKAELKLPLDVNEIVSLNENQYLILATIDTKNPDYYLYTDEQKTELNKTKEENKDYIEFDEYPFVFNGAGIVNGNRNALFVCDKNTLELKRITTPTMDVESFDIKGNKVLFTGVDFESVKGKFAWVYEYDLTTGTTEVLYKETMIVNRAFYLNDTITVVGTFGKEVGWIENPKIYELVDGKMELVVDCELSMYNSVGTDIHYGAQKEFKKVNDVAYFLSCSKGSRSELYKYEHRTLTCMTDFEGTVDGFVVARNEVYMITTMADRLQEVVRLSDMKELTNFNEGLKEYYVAKPNRVTVNKKTPIQGWVLLPEDFDENKKYPAILDIHGGPKCAYGEIFYHEMQYWANLGYIVFFCNPRGGDGRGNRFADLRRQWGGIDFEDIMDFTDEVLKLYPQIDVDNVGVTGGSYGGYMTNWIVGHTDRFKCAATQRSISNWMTEVCASDYGIDFPFEMQYTDLYNCHDELWSMSPLKYANNVNTPLLFIHSTEDYRCTFPEALQYYTAIKCRGVETKLVGFRGENHSLSRSGKPKHRIKRLYEITEWMNKHLL